MHDPLRIFLGVYFLVVILHAGWRSRGQGSPDPIRDSGPIL